MSEENTSGKSKPLSGVVVLDGTGEQSIDMKSLYEMLDTFLKQRIKVTTQTPAANDYQKGYDQGMLATLLFTEEFFLTDKLREMLDAKNAARRQG